jgi:hypothetical protein
VNRSRLFLAATALSIATAVHAASPSQPKVEYSADTMMETAEVSMKGHVNYTPTRERREMVTGSGGDKMIMITRHDKKVAWTLMPSEKIYMEMSLSQASAQAKDDISKYKIEQTVVGPETVNGVDTTKSKIIMTGPKGEKMGGFMWVSKDNIMVKMDAIAVDKKSKMRFKTELTDIKVAKQDPTLFELPAGYEKVGMPSFGSLMGGDDKQAGSKKSAGEPQEKKGFDFMDAVKLLK